MRCFLGCRAGSCIAEARVLGAYLKASNTGTDDQLGHTVSLSGDLLAVGAPWEASSTIDDQADNTALMSGAVYVFRRSATGTWAQEAYLKASNADASDMFGASVSVSGDLLAVGAPWEASSTIGDQADNSALMSGAVYVFRRSATGTWAQEAYLKASNADVDDIFGGSVSLFGNILAVGAPREGSSATRVGGDQADNSMSRNGAVYVFRRADAGTWAQEAYLKASNANVDNLFGGSVSLFGDFLAVGAIGNDDDDLASCRGAVFVFQRSATGTWIEDARLKVSNEGARGCARFGISVSLSENALAVGELGEDVPIPDSDEHEGVNPSPAVYVFRRSASGRWIQEAFLKGSNTGASDDFGASVALAGDLLAIGAPRKGLPRESWRDSENWRGAVYVFRRNAIGTWIQEAYVEAPNADAADFFGTSVSLVGDLLAVGAPGEDSSATGIGGDQADNSAPNSGAVYVNR